MSPIIFYMIVQSKGIFLPSMELESVTDPVAPSIYIAQIFLFVF